MKSFFYNQGKSLKITILLFCLASSCLQAQILNDSSTVHLIKKGIDDIYNFQFDEAHKIYTKIYKNFPGNPIVSLFGGLITYWENYPLVPSDPSHSIYEKEMRKCIELSDSGKYSSDKPEYLLANLCARGLLLMYYADNNMNFNVFPLATSTYRYIRRSFDFTDYYSDFFFFTGLYNYYREAYPEAFPIYKSFAFIFPKGNRQKGLEDLQRAAGNSIFLKGESASFLSGICLTFENNYTEASRYSKSLFELYPGNIQYLAVYIKNLLIIKDYDKAEKLNSGSNGINNIFFKAQRAIFNGILQEKKYHNTELAKEYYNEGIKVILPLGPYGNEYAAYAYFGLSRISEMNGDFKNQKAYRKKAFETANFKKLSFD
jgi:tetratricopeptide (TPR) repeat protein